MSVRRIVLVLAALIAAPASADIHLVLGRSFVVKDPRPGVDPTRRRVTMGAKEQASGALIVGNPTVDGAALAIETGATGDVIDLPAAGWRAVRSGFRYADKGGQFGAARSATIRRSANGTLVLRASLSGRKGTVNVLPPNPGTEAATAIVIHEGGTYCVHFGGVAGGNVTNVGAILFAIRKPTATGPCPLTVLPTTTTATTSTTTSTTVVPVCGNGVREGAEVCDGSDLGSCPAGISQCAAPGGACPACDCCVPPGGSGPSLSACCCDGGPCILIGPGTCVCAPPCGSQPFPTCGGLCGVGSNCSAYRVDGVDECDCTAPGPCDTTCGGECPEGFVCAVDNRAETCTCVPQ
jgi:hypothetical protein